MTGLFSFLEEAVTVGVEQFLQFLDVCSEFLALVCVFHE